jgi:hypothetical protein
MSVTDLDTAKAITKQFFRSAADPALEQLLTDTKGDYFRPYYVAAFMILADYRQLIRADEASFDYDKIWSVKGLLAMQSKHDMNDKNIPDQFTVDELLARLTAMENQGYEPGAFITSGMTMDADNCGLSSPLGF